jgi:hypothetical protein
MKLYAPVPYWDLSAEEKKYYRCGPGRGLLERLIPEDIYGVCITESCGIHDYMYQMGEPSDEGKAEADRVFLNNMLRQIEEDQDTDADLLMKRLDLAQLYFTFVRNFGGPAYWLGKNLPSQLG